MKLKIPKRRALSHSLGGVRCNFIPGVELCQAIHALNRRVALMGLTGSYTYSYIFREGAREFLRKTNLELDKVATGKLHGKRRK